MSVAPPPQGGKRPRWMAPDSGYVEATEEDEQEEPLDEYLGYDDGGGYYYEEAPPAKKSNAVSNAFTAAFRRCARAARACMRGLGTPDGLGRSLACVWLCPSTRHAF
jgi:hypothetical protein